MGTMTETRGGMLPHEIIAKCALAGLRWPTFQQTRGEGISVILPQPYILDNLSF